MDTKGHKFELTTFSSPVWCDICEKFIWGLKEQGYQCAACDLVAHKKCRSGSLQCSAVKQPKKPSSATGGVSREMYLDAERVQETKNGDIYQIEVTGTVPVCHWHYREGDHLWAYDDKMSEKIEDIYKKSISKGETVATLGDITFDFDKMQSKKEGASKNKWLNRGTWFYTDDDDTVRPYTVDICNKLEKVFQDFEVKDKLETGTFEVRVDEKPVRVVNSVSGTKMTEFKQLRFSHNGNPEGRPAMRGWNGKVLYRCTVELK